MIEVRTSNFGFIYRPVNQDRNTEADVTLINALVRAHRWSRCLAKGEYESVKEIASDE